MLSYYHTNNCFVCYHAVLSSFVHKQKQVNAIQYEFYNVVQTVKKIFFKCYLGPLKKNLQDRELLAAAGLVVDVAT